MKLIKAVSRSWKCADCRNWFYKARPRCPYCGGQSRQIVFLMKRLKYVSRPLKAPVTVTVK